MFSFTTKSIIWQEVLSHIWKKIGENVEPSELEEAVMRSTLIQQIVVIGQVNLNILHSYSSTMPLFIYVDVLIFFSSAKHRINDVLEL